MKTSHAKQIITLMPDCIEGKRKAQNEFYNILKPYMYSVCLYYADGGHIIAQELLQKGFSKCFERMFELKSHLNVVGWVYTVFRNIGVTYKIQKKCIKYIPKETINKDLDFTYSYLNDFDNDYDFNIITSNNLYGEMLDLYSRGYSYAEIAEQIEKPITTVKSGLCRFRSGLKNTYFK